MTKVTVYITTHNYGRYLEQAIESVLNQTMDDWELIVINDGSTDNTIKILEKYRDNSKIKIINQENRGLTVSNNVALRLSNGKYLIRLDGDDYFDENILMILSNVLDTKPEIGLAYSDYYRIDEKGSVIDLVHLNKVKNGDLFDIPAHGACTMIRKSCLMDINGYEEIYKCQDGYQLWLKFIQQFQPYNINLPLFYYRQHFNSLTKDREKILSTRAKIKKDFVKDVIRKSLPKILAIVPAIDRPSFEKSHALYKIDGKPLIWYTLTELLRSEYIDKIVVTTDSDKIAKYVSRFKNVNVVMRLQNYTQRSFDIMPAILHTLKELKNKYKYVPEAVLFAYVNTPLRAARHIEKAVNTMMIFNVDSVISVTEEQSFFYRHTNKGLKPLHKNRRIRIERDALYKENGLVYLSKLKSISSESFLGDRVGHIHTLPEESIKINSEFEFWQVEKILKYKKYAK